MLNEKEFRAIFEVPDFVVIKSQCNVIKSKPKRKTLDVVISVVSENKGVVRKGIVDLTGYSDHCIDRCIKYLIENKEITRQKIGMNGGYVKYAYCVGST